MREAGTQIDDDPVAKTQTIDPKHGNYSLKRFLSMTEESKPLVYIRGNSSILTLKEGRDGKKVEIYPLQGQEPNSRPIYDLVSVTEKRSYVIEILGGLPEDGVLKISSVWLTHRYLLLIVVSCEC